jgi:hypothetical protein
MDENQYDKLALALVVGVLIGMLALSLGPIHW